MCDLGLLKWELFGWFGAFWEGVKWQDRNLGSWRGLSHLIYRRHYAFLDVKFKNYFNFFFPFFVSLWIMCPSPFNQWERRRATVDDFFLTYKLTSGVVFFCLIDFLMGVIPFFRRFSSIWVFWFLGKKRLAPAFSVVSRIIKSALVM